MVEGRKQYRIDRIDRSHRTGGIGRRRAGGVDGVTIGRPGDYVPARSLAVYQAIGAQLALESRP